MDKRIYQAKNHIIRQKKFYVFLITLMIIGFISGALFTFFIKESDKSDIINEVTTFFNLIKSSTGINYSKSLINTLGINILYIFLIWILGISVIGFPIIIGILFIKSFIVGFSFSSIILTYKLKGLLGAFLYVFPHQIINLTLYLLLGFYSLSFCYKLFSHLFLKQTINFRYGINKYIKILLFCIGTSILLSLYEVFISTYLMKLFTILIK